MSGGTTVTPDPKDFIPLPAGSDLFRLPGRTAIGLDPKTGETVALDSWHGQRINAAAAFMAPGHMQTLRAAFRTSDNAPRLPFYAYAALGWKRGAFHAAGIRTDMDPRQDLEGLDIPAIEARARKLLASPLAKNRLAKHLTEHCVLRYGCPAARNFVLERYECPLPTSRACNARCVACISEQPCETCVSAPQDRILFTPTPEEIAEIAVRHIAKAPNPVVSFGQGCEGEPLLCADVLREAIRLIRSRTDQGIINLNTNASLPDRIESLFAAGLDSIRISLNSAQRTFYERYFRPAGYSFDAVLESGRVARRMNRWASFNYFIFPGFTDSPDEFSALGTILSDLRPNMIQTRNLNMDPDWYRSSLSLPDDPGFGLRKWLADLGKEFPSLSFGYFNPGRKFMRDHGHVPD
jgi:wyosine [tRNA(Phe)-imidazoG37] synthetase (radical SAM superfamily)